MHIQGLAEESGWHGEQLLQGVGRCKGQVCGEGLCELANEQPASRICILDYSCPGIIWRSWLCRVTNILSVMDLELYISSCDASGSYFTNSTYHSCIWIFCKGMLCPTCPYQPKCRCVHMYNCRGGAHGIQQEKLHTPVYPSLRLYCMRPTSQPKLKIYCLSGGKTLCATKSANPGDLHLCF